MEQASWLTSPEGAAAIDRAAGLLATGTALAAGTALRAEGLNPEQATAALQQAELRTLAADRYGITGTPLLTREGLEQATRPQVARHRATQLPAGPVIDLTAGLGFDSAAFLAAGHAVTCVERDPATAALLQANLPAATVVIADCRELELPTGTTVFVDPARRAGSRTADGRRAQSERDPERWSPPLSFVLALADRHAVGLKTAPGFTDIPAGWGADYVSVDRTLVEAALYSQPTFAERRRAVLIDGDSVVTVPGDQPGPSADAVGTWLLEADPAIAMADAFGSFAPAARIDDTDWLTSDARIEHSALRAFRVVEEVPADAKSLRALLRERGIGVVTVKSRHSGIEAGAFHRELRLDTSQRTAATIALIRLHGRVHAYLVEPQN